MFNGNYTSIDSILYEISRFPFVEGIDKEDIATFLVDFLRIVGTPIAFADKVVTLEVKGNRAKIPSDLIYLNGIRFGKSGNEESFVPMLYASNIYHSSIACKDSTDNLTCNSSTIEYILNNQYIQTSEKEGRIQLAYQTIYTDENNMPMIPDDVKIKMALKYFILWQYTEPAFYRNDVPNNVYNDIKQQYFWYMGAAKNSLNMPSPDQMKTIENGLIRLIKSSTQHETHWKNFSKKEDLSFNRPNNK